MIDLVYTIKIVRCIDEADNAETVATAWL